MDELQGLGPAARKGLIEQEEVVLELQEIGSHGTGRRMLRRVEGCYERSADVSPRLTQGHEVLVELQEVGGNGVECRPDLEEISAKDLVGLIQLKRIIGACAQSDQIVAELYEGVADVARARAQLYEIAANVADRDFERTDIRRGIELEEI